MPKTNDGYPFRISCRVIPSLEEGISTIEVTDRRDSVHIYNVPSELVQAITMPRLAVQFKEENGPFESGIGLGIVACRFVYEDDNTISVALPVAEGEKIVSLPVDRLIRTRKSKS